MKPLQEQKKSPIYHSFDPVSIIRFLSAFQLARDTNGVYEGDALWLLQFFEMPHFRGAESLYFSFLKVAQGQKQGTGTSYMEAIHYLLETDATDNVITKRDADKMRPTPQSDKTSPGFTGPLWNKALQCHRIYDEVVIEFFSTEGLSESISHSI